ncbi:MAG: aspartate 1-decarboxylase [candidate division Zixibacteria bacterium]|nr:aspartate 1-decarboxylase [candidate division Zixibacteria bacterium]
MFVTICKSKIHRATVTDCDLNYIGSITIDSELMKLTDIIPYEKVQIVDINNGERFETYAIEGEPGSGDIIINGAAARKVSKDDLVIIIAYGQMERKEADGFAPKVVYVDKNNKPVS